MAQENIKSQIQGLISVKEKRGLVGDQALWCWTISALSVLLKAELARIERSERIAANLNLEKR